MRSDSREPSPSGEGRVGIDGLRILSAFGDRRLVGPTPPRRAFGVPPGGPFDRLAAALANALVGLDDEAPTLEIALGPIVFEAAEPLVVAVVGGPEGAFPMATGERFEVRPTHARAYVATDSGPSPFAGSRRLADPPRSGDAPLRVLPAPSLPSIDFDLFIGQTYTLGWNSDRVGLRLLGRRGPHTLDLPSEPSVPGAVQIPPDGNPIVLGPDGPTIGGYPKIAYVIDADLDRLARLRPGDPIRFVATTPRAAREARRLDALERGRRCAELRAARG